jgi:hypothetical protein
MSKSKIPEEFKLYCCCGHNVLKTTVDEVRQTDSWKQARTNFVDRREALYYARLLLQKYKFSYIVTAMQEENPAARQWFRTENLTHVLVTNYNLELEYELEVFRLKEKEKPVYEYDGPAGWKSDSKS